MAFKKEEQIREDFALTETFPVISKRKVFACPYCSQEILLPVKIQLLEPIKAESQSGPDPLRGLTPDQISIIEFATKNGIMEPFSAAYRRAQLQGHGDPGRLFVQWIKTCVPKTVPAFVVSFFAAKFKTRVDFFGAQGVIAVMSGRMLLAFVPQKYVLGTLPSTMNGNASRSARRIFADTSDFHDWVKTPHGYVPHGCDLFLSELRRKCIGEFADVRV